MTSGKPVVNVSMCGHIQTTTRRDPDNREINSTGKKLALRFVAYKFEFGHHPSLYPPHVHITWLVIPCRPSLFVADLTLVTGIILMEWYLG